VKNQLLLGKVAFQTVTIAFGVLGKLKGGPVIGSPVPLEMNQGATPFCKVIHAGNAGAITPSKF
jgi:hypothetical protein